MNQTNPTNQEPMLEAATTDYAIHHAIQFYRDSIQQKRINQYSENTKCVSLKTLVKNAILTTDEINDVRMIDLDTLSDRIESSLETLSTVSIKTYVRHAPTMLFVNLYTGRKRVLLN